MEGDAVATMQKKRVKPLASIWSAFRRTKRPGKRHADAECIHCSQRILQAQPHRDLVKHVSKCTMISSDARSVLLVKYCAELSRTSSDRSKSVGGHSHDVDEASSTRTCTCGARSPSQSLPKPIVKTQQLALTRFIVSTGSAFRIVENYRFRVFIQLLCPKFVFPDRHRVATTLLDEVYNEEMELAKLDLMKPDYLCLETDGWTDPNQESIVGYSRLSPITGPIFWKSTCTGASEHTADFYTREVRKVIDDVESIDGIGKITGVTSDNAAVMLKMHDKIEAERPDIFGNGCSSHAANLLSKDILENGFFKQTASKATKLVKFIKKRTGLSNTFKRLNKGMGGKQRGLSYPVKTRWNSALSCLKSVLENKGTIKALFQQDDLMKRYTKNAKGKMKCCAVQGIVADTEFWERADFLVSVLDPIGLRRQVQLCFYWAVGIR